MSVCDYIKFAPTLSVGRVVTNTLRCQQVLMMQWLLEIQEVKSFSKLGGLNLHRIPNGCVLLCLETGTSNLVVSPLQTWKVCDIG